MAGGAMIGALRVTLGADTAQFEAGMRRTNRQMDQTRGSFRSLSQDATKAGSVVRSAFSSLGAVGAAVGGAAIGTAARSFLSLADESKNLAAQLQLATAKTGTFGQAQADVARIASSTREGLTATASLYGNFMRAIEPLGAKQADAARATETFGKALKIGGADANAAASATLQFGQALAAGALRGDEFNSIAEASPRIVRLIGEAMGVTQGEVRALAAEGKLTSDVLFRALTDRKFTAGIDAEFSKLPVTFDQAMTLVRNAAVTTFGAFDQGGQFSTALADFIGRGADGFALLASSAEAEGRNIRGTFEGLRDVFSPLMEGARAAFGDIRSQANYTRETIASILSGLDQLYNLYAKAENFGTRIENRIKRATGLGTPKPVIAERDSAGDFLRTARRSDARSRVDAAARRLKGMGFEVPRNRDGSVNEAGIRRVERIAPIRPPRPSSGGASRPGGRSGGSSRNASGPVHRSTSQPMDEVRSILDGLFPDEARIAELREKAATLGKALAAKLIPEETYARAKDVITSQIGNLLAKSRTAIEAPELVIPARTTDVHPLPTLPDLTKAKAVGGFDIDVIRQAFESLGSVGRGCFGDIADSIATDLIPALQKGEAGAMSLQSKLMAGASAITSGFQAIFGRKWGGVLGSLVNIGVSAYGGGRTGSLPGFATGGSFTVQGLRGIDMNTLSLNNMPIANVSHGETVSIGTGDTGPRGGRNVTVHQTIQYSGAVDIADKAFVARMADAARQAAISGIRDADRRRG